MKRLACLTLLCLNAAFAAEPANGLAIGGFVDAYSAWDFNRPPTRDRAFTTQPARHNEFNVNLAYLEGKLQRENVRGRLALQAGTSVQSNYAGEPNIGSISGPSVARNLQEAYAGYRIGAQTWIDAGILLSHIGVESFVSKDNLLYTRSLVADYSPYYEAGARLSTRFGDRISAQLLVLNGWQNISENNSDKALGTQLAYSPDDRWTLVYNTFVGREAEFRHFHDFIVKFSPSDAWALQLQADLGFQKAALPGAPDSRWYGFSFMGKRRLSATVSLNGRVERYADPDQVIVATGSSSAFEAWGASLGVDTALDEGAWWRNEIRGYRADEAVLPGASGAKTGGAVAVSSISVAF